MCLELSMMATKRYSHAYEYARAKPRRASCFAMPKLPWNFYFFPPRTHKTIPCSKRSYAPSMPRKRRTIGTEQKQT